MPKIVLGDINNIRGNPTSAQSSINSNSAALETAFDNTLSRDGSGPNQMLADFDMNHNDIVNAQTIDTDTLLIKGRPVSFAGDLINAAAVNIDEKLFTGDGSTKVFDLDLQHTSTDTLSLVWIGGAIQDTNEYDVSGSDLIFVDAPYLDADIRVLTFTGISYNDVLDLSDQSAASASAAAQSAADAQTAADSVAGLVSDYTSVPDVQAAAVPGTYKFVRTKFHTPSYAVPETLVGGAVYRRSDATEVSDFPSAAWFTDADNAYWLLTDPNLNPCMFGAKGDGTTDDLVPLQAAIDYLATSTGSVSGKKEAFSTLDLAGRVFLISNQLILRGSTHRDCLVVMKNGGIKVSSSFAAQANAATSPRPAIIVKNGGYGVRVENVFLDCNKKSSGICMVPNSQSSRQSKIINSHIVRFVNPLLLTESLIDLGTERPSNPQYNLLRPYGIRIGQENSLDITLNSSMETLEGNFIAQFETDDLEYDTWEKITGLGIMCYAIDSKIRHNVVDTVRKGITVMGWHNEISFNHPSPPNGNVHSDGIDHSSDHISCIEIVQYGNNRIIGNYVDNGYITLYQENQIITDNYITKNPESTFGNTTGIRFVAQSVNQDFAKNFTIDNNKIMETLDRLVSFYEPGSFNFINKVGSFSIPETAKIGSSQHGIVKLDSGKSALVVATGFNSTDNDHDGEPDSDSGRSYIEFHHETQPKTVYAGSWNDDGTQKFAVNIDETDTFTISEDQIEVLNHQELLGVRCHLNNHNSDTTINTAYANRLVVSNSGSAVVFTLAKNTQTGTVVRFVRKNSGSVTLTPESGAKINGGTGSKTLTQYLGCTAYCYWNGDGNSAEWTLEGTFS